MKLTRLDHLPDGLLDLPADRLHECLQGPTLIHLGSGPEPPLFVSALLHGNETGGWEAMRKLLAAQVPLPRRVDLLIGNVRAARAGRRHLDDQADFNRIWRSADPAHRFARELLAYVRKSPPFACIDLHNNTGINPHYACVPDLSPATLTLARRFAPLAVYVRQPQTTLMNAFATLCPTVTLESGRPGEIWGADHMRRFVTDVLEQADFPELMPGDLVLYHTVVTVKVRSDVQFGFDAQDWDLRLLPEFEHTNFQHLPAGALLGYCEDPARMLSLTDESGREVLADYLTSEQGELRLLRPVVPAMFSIDKTIVRQDCLCYFMEPLVLETPA